MTQVRLAAAYATIIGALLWTIQAHATSFPDCIEYRNVSRFCCCCPAQCKLTIRSVTTTQGNHAARSVLLTIGRRGTPRQLGVPGEEKSKVVYRLIDAEQYEGQHVLVVGGGDSALEAAHSIAEQPGTTVTISYRSEAFTRAKPKNRDKVAAMGESGRMRLLMSSSVKEIQDDNVILEQEGKHYKLRNDSVIVCAGGILPTGFLKEIGIEVETKYGTA